MPFNLISGSDNQFEVQRIIDFRPKSAKKNGAACKVKELSFFVMWLGLSVGTDAWQPWSNLKGTCDDALAKLAESWQLPSDTCLKGSHKLPNTAGAASLRPATATGRSCKLSFCLAGLHFSHIASQQSLQVAERI